MFDSVATAWGFGDDADPDDVRRRLGLIAPEDGGAPAGLLPRLLQLTEFTRLRALDEHELVETIAALASVEAWAAAAQRDAAATLQSRQGRAEADPRRPGRVEVTGSAADSLAMRLGVSRSRASRLVGEGRLFGDVLHPVGTALADGRIDAGKASVFADLLVEQPPEVCFAVCEQVLPDAPGLTHHALRQRIQAVIIQVDPRTAHERTVRAAESRRLDRVHLLPDGMASLRLVAPLIDVVAVHTMAESSARAARAAGDDRTLDQLRADALVAVAAHALAAGRIDACEHGAGSPRQGHDETPATASLSTSTSPATSSSTAAVELAGLELRGLAPPGSVPRDANLDGALAAAEQVLTRLRTDSTPLGEIRGRARSLLATQRQRRRRGIGASRPEDPPPSTATRILGTTSTGDLAPPGASGFVPFSGTTSRVTLALSPAHLAPDDGAACAADVFAWEFSPGALVDGAANPFDAFEAPERCRPGIDVPELLGFGPIDPTTARHLVGIAPPYLRVAVITAEDDGERALPATATDAYVPGAELARRVRRVHPCCVAPSCTVPSTACDLDHVIPWPAGPTSENNLRPLCRHHHLIKTHLGHDLMLDGDGSALWITPEGHRYRRPVGGDTRLVPSTPSPSSAGSRIVAA